MGPLLKIAQQKVLSPLLFLSVSFLGAEAFVQHIRQNIKFYVNKLKNLIAYLNTYTAVKTLATKRIRQDHVHALMWFFPVKLFTYKIFVLFFVQLPTARYWIVTLTMTACVTGHRLLELMILTGNWDRAQHLPTIQDHLMTTQRIHQVRSTKIVS